MAKFIEAPPSGPVQVIGAMLSHTGLVRSANEDTVAFVLPEAGSDLALEERLPRLIG
jgi:hypothetical protein